MKLKTKQLLFTKNLNKPLFLIFTFLYIFFFSLPSFSQQIKITFTNTSLADALVEISKKMDIRISFDSGQLEKINISKTITGNTGNELISDILEGTDYTSDYKFETFLIFKKTDFDKPRTTKEITLTGIVYDRKTGERLPNASIFLWKKNVTVSTSVDGTFSIRLADSASNILQVKYLGYYLLDTVINPANATDFLSFGLSAKSEKIATINVTGEKLEMVDFSVDAGHLTINPIKFADLPNYGETDVFRVLQLMPGISSFENSSQLNIRGSSPDQNLVMFDGFTLYNLDHFFGLFSALNPNVIKDIQVYRGGFDSRYGERVSGIVDITGKSGNQQKPEFYGGINLISGNLTTEIPVNKKITLVAAGRRAYSDVYSSWFADALLADKFGQNQRFPDPNANTITPEFYFSDYNLKLTFTPNQQENFSFSYYGAKDYLNSSNINTNDRGEMNTEDINKWGNYGFGAAWKKQWNAKSFTNLQIGHSGYFNDYYNNTVFTPANTETNPPGSLNEEVNESNELSDFFVSFQNKYFLNQNNLIEYGLTGKYNEFSFYKDASRDFIYDNLKSSAFLYSLYFQDKINVGNNITLKPGLRTNYYEKIGKIYFEPRFAANLKTKQGLLFKLSAGRYYQYLSKSATEQSFGYNRDFWILADGDVNPVISSNHFIAGAGYETKHLFFDMEAYYKNVDGLQEYLFFQNPADHQKPVPGNDVEPNPGLSQFISGKGKAIGIDFLVKYENTHFSGWLGYSLSKASRRFAEINNGAEIPALYDQTHQIKWTNMYSIKKWNFSAVSIYTTGKPYIKSSAKEDNFNTTRVYSRLPDYYRTDISANYNFNIKNVNIKPGLSVLNAFNTKNYLDIYVREFNFENNQISETTLVEAQKLMFNFFLNFRF